MSRKKHESAVATCDDGIESLIAEVEAAMAEEEQIRIDERTMRGFYPPGLNDDQQLDEFDTAKRRTEKRADARRQAALDEDKISGKYPFYLGDDELMNVQQQQRNRQEKMERIENARPELIRRYLQLLNKADPTTNDKQRLIAISRLTKRNIDQDRDRLSSVVELKQLSANIEALRLELVKAMETKSGHELLLERRKDAQWNYNRASKAESDLSRIIGENQELFETT